MAEPHQPSPSSPRDRVIADTGWGIKPDDQPSNAHEAAGGPAAASRTLRYDPTEPNVVRRILLAQRRTCNTANRVRLERSRVSILDINGDPFVVEGLGFGDPNLVPLLQSLGAAFDPQDLKRLSTSNAPDGGGSAPIIREYALSRAWAWGAERSG